MWRQNTYRNRERSGADGVHKKIEIQIPANTTAMVVIHMGDRSRIQESGKPLENGDGILHVDSRDTKTYAEIGSGTYVFTWTEE